MFSSKKAVRLDKDLYERLEKKAGEAGYATTDEFIAHVLETACSGGDDSPDRDEVDRQLRGLGYLE